MNDKGVIVFKCPR